MSGDHDSSTGSDIGGPDSFRVVPSGKVFSPTGGEEGAFFEAHLAAARDARWGGEPAYVVNEAGERVGFGDAAFKNPESVYNRVLEQVAPAGHDVEVHYDPESMEWRPGKVVRGRDSALSAEHLIIT